MYDLFLLIALIGFIFLIYSLICRRRINIYHKGDIEEMINEEGFYKVQFNLSMMNAGFLLISGIIFYVIKPIHFFLYIAAILTIFHLINYGVIFISKRKSYIKT